MITKYLSGVSRAAAVKYEKEGVRTEDLEKKVFGADFGQTGISHMQALAREVQAYEQRLVQIGLAEYAGAARAIFSLCEAIGIPAVAWNQQRKQQQLERVLGELEEKRGSYDRDILARQRSINRQYDIRDAARVLVERYQNLLTDLKATMTEQQAAHATHLQEASQSESKAYLASGMQLGNLRSDFELTTERLRASLLKLDQARASATMLEGLQTQMYALRQRLHKSELRVRRVLEHARIMSTKDRLSIPSAVREMSAGELSSTSIATQTCAVEAATWEIVEKIHGAETTDDQQADHDHLENLRTAVAEEDDRLLQQALEIQ